MELECSYQIWSAEPMLGGVPACLVKGMVLADYSKVIPVLHFTEIEEVGFLLPTTREQIEPK